jgi:hypothetical protein
VPDETGNDRASQPAWTGRRVEVTEEPSSGVAPARAYVEELLPDILEGRVQPGSVFDRTVTLDEVPAGYQAEQGILTQAWSPIGGITFYRDGSHGSTLQDPLIGEIAKAHGKTAAQVTLRWPDPSDITLASFGRPIPEN